MILTALNTEAVEAFREFYDSYFEMFLQQFLDEARGMSSHILYNRAAVNLLQVAPTPGFDLNKADDLARWVIIHYQTELYLLVLKYAIAHAYYQGRTMHINNVFNQFLSDMFG